MKSELIPLYSAIFSAGVAFVVAWLSSRRTIRLEINKLRLATQQLAFSELLKVRIQEYPKLYSILSDLGKIARDESVAVNLEDIRDRIEQWDSAHAIFMTRETSNKCHNFRSILRRAAKPQSDRRISGELLRAAEELELALRSDMGIHGISMLGMDLAPTQRDSYTDA